jgi:hypothetical protein
MQVANGAHAFEKRRNMQDRRLRRQLPTIWTLIGKPSLRGAALISRFMTRRLTAIARLDFYRRERCEIPCLSASVLGGQATI